MPEDLFSIQDILLRYDALFIRQPIYDTNDILMENLTYPLQENQFDKVYVTKKEFIDSLTLEKVEKQEYYLINDICSNVISFSRGGFLYDKNKLERSRFYYVYSYYKDNIIVEKRQELQKWAIKLFTKVKQEVITNKYNNEWFSDNALKWMKTNGAHLHQSGLYIS